MAEYAGRLAAELSGALAQADRALSGKDVGQVETAIGRLDGFIKALDETSNAAKDAAKDLIRHGLRLGADPQVFYGVPFSDTIVRSIRSELGLPPRKRGPAPRDRRPRPEQGGDGPDAQGVA